MKKELDEKKAEYDKMKAEYDEFKKKDSEDKAKAKKAKDDEEEEDCKNFLNAAVVQKVIKIEAVTNWLDKLKTGKMSLKEIKDTITDISGGTIKKAAVIPAGGGGGSKEADMATLEDGIGTAMREVKNKFYAGRGKVGKAV